MEQPNALALEYQRDYGTASGNIDILNLVNNPMASGVCRVYGPGFLEDLGDLFAIDFAPLRNDGANPPLVTEKTI